jgi:hypothetical protein
VNWLLLAKGLAALFSWLQQKQLIDAGQALQLAAALRVQADEMERASKARIAARDSARTVGPGSLPDDGFRRD